MAELRDVATDQQDQGLATPTWVIPDRDIRRRRAGRYDFSHRPRLLYDAFGQREVLDDVLGLTSNYVWRWTHSIAAAQTRYRGSSSMSKSGDMVPAFHPLPSHEIAVLR